MNNDKYNRRHFFLKQNLDQSKDTFSVSLFMSFQFCDFLGSLVHLERGSNKERRTSLRQEKNVIFFTNFTSGRNMII